MKTILLIGSVVLLINCSKENNKCFYSSICQFIVEDSIHKAEVKLWLHGDSAIIESEGMAPVKKFANDTSLPKNTIQFAGLHIDYSNLDSIYGISTRMREITDTLTVYDSSTFMESMTIVKHDQLDTIGNCLFVKAKSCK